VLARFSVGGINPKVADSNKLTAPSTDTDGYLGGDELCRVKKSS